ncbi:MAG TPA: molybdate ABC transporter substrate-binding protein [Armatimonadota bacterium]|nr:molybdate ABC transporter substrate-binding protein [Armatimonadota bacterium]
MEADADAPAPASPKAVAETAKAPELEGRLLFHAGTGQRAALDEISELFRAKHPKVKVDFSYKGSGYFLADIMASREGDLYMPGEAFYVDQAAERGFVEEYEPEKHTAAYFVTVIATPKGNPKNIKTIEDFARPGVRVGLGDPKACAVGEWHERIFKKAGIFDAVKKNAIQNAQCIPELGNATKLGAIDATIIWTPTAAVYLKDIEIIPMPEGTRAEIPLPVVVLTTSKNKAVAKVLQDFVLSDEGRACFRKHAYVLDRDRVESEVEWLVEAARVAKDPSVPINEETCGHLVEEVRRQRH